MARSSYVYVVIPKGHMTPEAAFTVKHECNSWLNKRRSGAALPPCLVYRLGDNRNNSASTYVWDNPDQI